MLILHRSRTGSSMPDAELHKRKLESTPTANQNNDHDFVLWYGVDRHRTLHGHLVVSIRRHSSSYITSSHVISVFSEPIWLIAPLLFLLLLSGYCRILFFPFPSTVPYICIARLDAERRSAYFILWVFLIFKTIPLGCTSGLFQGHYGEWRLMHLIC
jgi:hypothetical protein